MKVIGTVTNDKFIVEISDVELANTQGFSSTYSNGYKQPRVGDTINVSAIYKRLKELKSLSDKSETVSKYLLEMAEKLKPINKFIEEQISQKEAD